MTKNDDTMTTIHNDNKLLQNTSSLVDVATRKECIQQLASYNWMYDGAAANGCIATAGGWSPSIFQ